MIELSLSEQTSVYGALVPDFRTERRRYPTEYRGGDSRDGLSIDLERGWFDFPIDKGGDCIDFVKHARDCDFREAIRWISDVVGRDITANECRPIRPRITAETLAKAELFRVGLCWQIERALVIVKRHLWTGEGHRDAEDACRRLTSHLAAARRWTQYEAARVYMRGARTEMVRQCVAEAHEASLGLAFAITGNRRVAAA